MKGNSEMGNKAEGDFGSSERDCSDDPSNLDPVEKIINRSIIPRTGLSVTLHACV